MTGSSFSPHYWALRLLPLWLISVTQIHAAGIQSGPSAANSYAGGMFYDANNNMVYITGQTYGDDFAESSTAYTGSNCFVAAINMNAWDWDDAGVLMGNNSTAISTCQSIGFLPPSTLLVGGNSEPGGLAYDGSEVMTGFMLVSDRNAITQMLNHIPLLPTTSGRVEYPQFFVTQGSNIFAISLSSIDTKSADAQTLYPTYMTQFKYGSSFDMTVRKLQSQQNEFLGVPIGPISLQSSWVQEFPIDVNGGDTPSSVFVGGVIVKQHKFLIVAGSTRGVGMGYGEAEGTDEDGFITLLDLDTGELYNDAESLSSTNNVRIGSAADDAVLGICDDPTDPSAFFVVGATAGQMDDDETALPPASGSFSGFVSKINVESLTTSWSRQWGARISAGDSSTITHAFAVGCSVVGDTLYVAGGVDKGAGIIFGQDVLASNGNSDIWVASIQTDDGRTNWIKQVGTPENDQLARHGAVAADLDGNVILYGNTLGSFYRDGDSDSYETSDVFVMMLDADDGYHAPLGQPVAAPTDAPVAATQAPVSLPTLPPEDFVPVGDQLKGPLFAGGMVYDARNNQAWLTGSTYVTSDDSKCFVTSVDLNTGKISAPTEFGKQGTDEACMAIDYSQLQDLVYVAGGTQTDGYLVDNETVNPPNDSSNLNSVQFGLMMQVDAATTTLNGAAVNQNDVVQYPIAIVADPNQDVIFVASMSSDNPEQINVPSGETPNFTSGGIRPFGDEFFTVIQRFRVIPTSDGNGVQKVLDEEFYQWYGIDEATESVLTSGMILAGDGNTLVVVGSTRGTSSDGPFGAENSGGEWDGFIMKLDPATGALKDSNGHRASTRLDSINQKDDWVTNVCNDRYDHDAFYVVGASAGKVRDLSDDEQPPEGTTHAFVAKVNLETLTAEWLKHFTMQASSGLAEASAYGCVVTSEVNGSNLVYVAGVVQGGATLDNAQRTPASDMDDLFVVQLNGGDGSVNWIHQIGTSMDERLAHGGGIDVDANGNAIVFAETAGTFYAERSSDATSNEMDLVVFTMKKEDGSYKQLGASGAAPSPTPVGPDVLPDNIAAHQTGPDVGPSYAGGMYYDRFTNSIYITGATYGSFDGPGVKSTDFSSCFFGIIELPKLQFRSKSVYGNENVDEACNAISLTTIDSEASAIVVGSTEKGGIMTQLGSGDVAMQYGVALDLASIDGLFQLQGGALMDQNSVQFPVAVETSDDGIVWIVSMTSSDSAVSASYDKTSTEEYPNLTTGGIEKFGAKYRIVIERYELIRSSTANTDMVLETTLQQTWRKPFETADQESIFLSDMIRVKNGGTLIVVGSTRGSKNAADMDGIMAKIDPDEGSFRSEGRGARSVAYFSSVTGRDDWILGACADPDDESFFYIVGATQGKIDSDAVRDNNDVTVHAVVAKMHVESLTATWTKQFSVTHADGIDTKGAAASAFGCDVIDGAGFMYIAGTVENGATIDQGKQKSAGRDDIFVAKLSTRDGNVAWMKQVGSNGDDRVAHGGGVKVDANGNAVVYGDTNGSFFRERTSDGSTEDHSDLFIMIFNQDDGSHTQPIIAPPTDLLPADNSTPKEWYPNGVTEDRLTVKMMSLGIIALLLLALVFCCFCLSRRKARKRAEAQKTSIFAYLQQFDVEDIDLRKSPPGGWHGTYLHKLAYGINKAESGNHGRLPEADPHTKYETAPLTHSSVVRDSLFMETSSSPSLGYRDDPEMHGLDGYDDLRPRTYEERSSSLKQVI